VGGLEIKSGSSRLVSVGYNNFVALNRIVAIVSANTLPARRLIGEARKNNKLVDATNGRRTRSVIVMDSDHIVLSSVLADTIVQRLK
jgi:regulator of extracellular matrix RemA (YlzA/DUF370 family)